MITSHKPCVSVDRYHTLSVPQFYMCAADIILALYNFKSYAASTLLSQ
jgi:hypothetical protein